MDTLLAKIDAGIATRLVPDIVDKTKKKLPEFSSLVYEHTEKNIHFSQEYVICRSVPTNQNALFASESDD